jgi:hypothetical protein
MPWPGLTIDPNEAEGRVATDSAMLQARPSWHPDGEMLQAKGHRLDSCANHPLDGVDSRPMCCRWPKGIGESQTTVKGSG